MQDEYSLLYREEEREMLAYCKYNGIGVIPWAPLASGLLARPVGTETTRLNSTKGTALEKKVTSVDAIIINRVEEVAKKKNCKMSQIALAWVASKLSSPIVGISSVQRLQESIIEEIELTPEEIKYLEEPYEPKVIRGHL
jgi:aryl-alcohol dehydrogenase-like predicted oxidoreductase